MVEIITVPYFLNNQPKLHSSLYLTRLTEDLLSAFMDAAPYQSSGIPRVLCSAKGTCQSLSWVNGSHQFFLRCPLAELAQFLQDCCLLVLLMVIATNFAHFSSSASMPTSSSLLRSHCLPWADPCRRGDMSSLPTG